jgi:apolipoprotein N-acyltransferase
MWTVSSLSVKVTSPANVKGKNVKRKWSGHVFWYRFCLFLQMFYWIFEMLLTVLWFFLFFILFTSYIMDKMSVNEAFQE